MSYIKMLSGEELNKWLKTKKVTLIDVRTFSEAEKLTIDGSILIPLHLIPLELDRIRSMKGNIVVFCRTGARSSQACLYLQNNYVDNVFNLEGGINTFLKAKT